MDIERLIEARMKRPMPHRRYRQYSRPFRILLALTDIVSWLYFFGVPFFPPLLPHLSDFDSVIRFFVEGFTRGMK